LARQAAIVAERTDQAAGTVLASVCFPALLGAGWSLGDDEMPYRVQGARVAGALAGLSVPCLQARARRAINKEAGNRRTGHCFLSRASMPDRPEGVGATMLSNWSGLPPDLHRYIRRNDTIFAAEVTMERLIKAFGFAKMAALSSW